EGLGFRCAQFLRPWSASFGDVSQHVKIPAPKCINGSTFAPSNLVIDRALVSVQMSLPRDVILLHPVAYIPMTWPCLHPSAVHIFQCTFVSALHCDFACLYIPCTAVHMRILQDVHTSIAHGCCGRPRVPF